MGGTFGVRRGIRGVFFKSFKGGLYELGVISDCCRRI